MIDVVFDTQPEYGKLVNFSQNMSLPIHNWFNLKEGYSAELVTELMSHLKIREGKVLDPFSGCGTTLLTAKKRGLQFLGFEVNPFLYTLTRAKTTDYDSATIASIRKYSNIIGTRAIKIKKLEEIELSIAAKVFGSQLEYVLRYRQTILGIQNEKVRNFFLVAFLSILEPCGTAKKDGNGLRYPPRKKVASFVDEFEAKIAQMLTDIESLDERTSQDESKVIYGDCRNIHYKVLAQHKNSAALSVFSPPYLNCFDYSEIYKIELWFGGFVKRYPDLKEIRNSSLTSHLNKEISSNETLKVINKYLKLIETKDVWSPKIPKLINNYFIDMQKVLKNVHTILKQDAYCVIIVGNSAYGEVVIPTDEILGRIAETLGFKLVKISTARKLNTSPQQQKKIKEPEKLRESLVYLKKC